MLHAKDESPIHYEKVCASEGKPVAWEDLVKGYEYEKGQFIVVTDEDFKRANVEATQTVEIEIQNFDDSPAPGVPAHTPSTSRCPRRSTPIAA